MSSDETKIPTPEEEKNVCPDAAGADCGCDTPEPEMPEVNADPAVDQTDLDEAETATDELMKWRDMAMRTAAEYDNYRKRCIKEREDFNRYATQRLLEELLPVVDNFEMGMMMAAQQDTNSMIYIGMNMVQKQLADFLENQGATAINAEVGEAFDHNKHEAIQSEASELPEGSIVRVIRKGYMLKDRLLRPVNVVTAAAPAAEAAPEA
ncbi:MAG: nucleotide exchange factor GrpE [Akkermansia sp.]